jgi:hypothetical protein
MARMLARVHSGDDDGDAGWSKIQVRLAERNETLREADLYMRERRDRNEQKVVENYFA